MWCCLKRLAPRIPDQGSCRFQVTGLDGTFSRSDVPEDMVNHSRDFQVPLDCTWVITVAETHKVCYYINSSKQPYIYFRLFHSWFQNRFNWVSRATHWWRPTSVTSTLLKSLAKWRIYAIDCVFFVDLKLTLFSPNRIFFTWDFSLITRPWGLLLMLSSLPSLFIAKLKVFLHSHLIDRQVKL